ncbi:MAG: c-type cytochrome [Anaerolineales bacterium]|uniref:C-type cytochrome n=1 Tax=Candidatus Desulfolinea nitratireducens TaxID=2841698 RepID=A0A8J6NKU7_9CHLR|nr:c-type cytochrome [Candidatus Desulfolinea nitratireducens]MBL6961441.1 c-type cytochrome [Anaerolineales bacterium]
MNDDFKKKVNEKYEEKLQKGERFWPDSIYKDLLVSFALFILLIGLATFIGIHPEPKVDPTDASYVPRPEWYFLFLFEFLKYFPGEIEWVGAAVIPGILVLALILLPLYDKNPFRHYSKRKFAIGLMTFIVIGMIGLTINAVITTPPQVETEIAGSLTEQIVLGQDLYSIQCVECHGPDGEGGEIAGVEGLEGVIVKSISSTDEMYTRNDGSLFDIIAYGQPNLGMPPFGGAYGGELTPSEIEYMVAFMRYSWDDRAEIPADAVAASAIPTLAEGEVPSYEVHISAVSKRYCMSCHREGKENNEYLMGSYEEILKSGNNVPNLVAGDLNSILLQTIQQNEVIGVDDETIGVMPPKKELKPEFVDMFIRWVEAGMPESASEAAALSVEVAPEVEGEVAPEAGVEETPAP